MTGTPEYDAWCHAKQRCYDHSNKRWAEYGGRGIRMCDEWRDDFPAFFAHVGKRPSRRHSLDRIKVHGHYEPGNVRWATATQQANNSRQNRLVEWNGRTLTIAEWAKERGLPFTTLYQRLCVYGWTPDKAMTTPKMSQYDRSI